MDIRSLSTDSNSTLTIESIGDGPIPNFTESERDCSPFPRHINRTDTVMTFISLNLMRGTTIEKSKHNEIPIANDKCTCEIY